MTIKERFTSTLHELADSKKAMTTLASMLAGVLTMAGGVLSAHFGAKLGVDSSLTSKIPEYSAYAAAGIVGLGINYVHGQAKVDVATVQQASVVGTPTKEQAKELVAAVIENQVQK